MSDLLGDIGFGPLAASLAPNDQSHLGSERLTQGHRLGLAFTSVGPHNEIMPELDDAGSREADEKATRLRLYSEIQAAAAGFGLTPRELDLKTLPELSALAAYWAAKVNGDELGMQRAMMAHNLAERDRPPTGVGRGQLIINRLCLTAIIVGALYVATGPDTEARGLVTAVAFLIAIIALVVWTDRVWKGKS